mgnify:FL=1
MIDLLFIDKDKMRLHGVYTQCHSPIISPILRIRTRISLLYIAVFPGEKGCVVEAQTLCNRSPDILSSLSLFLPGRDLAGVWLSKEAQL